MPRASSLTSSIRIQSLGHLDCNQKQKVKDFCRVFSEHDFRILNPNILRPVFLNQNKFRLAFCKDCIDLITCQRGFWSRGAGTGSLVVLDSKLPGLQGELSDLRALPGSRGPSLPSAEGPFSGLLGVRCKQHFLGLRSCLAEAAGLSHPQGTLPPLRCWHLLMNCFPPLKYAHVL